MSDDSFFKVCIPPRGLGLTPGVSGRWVLLPPLRVGWQWLDDDAGCTAPDSFCRANCTGHASLACRICLVDQAHTNKVQGSTHLQLWVWQSVLTLAAGVVTGVWTCGTAV